MDQTTIETWQASRISKSLHPSLNYLFRLRTRMEKVGFTPNDRLFVLVCDAYVRITLLIALALYLPACLGCGTICNLAGGITNPDEEPRIYGGVIRDLDIF